MSFPRSLPQLLPYIARETARMSYPSSMSRGKSPVVLGKTKATLEAYFVERFPIGDLWTSANDISQRYEPWHRARVRELVVKIAPHIQANYVSESVAAKFLNTFMHQIIKYNEARPLLPLLRLPLDRRVVAALRRIQSPALNHVHRYLQQDSPYTLPYAAHLRIQHALSRFVSEVNESVQGAFQLQGRVELNWLWATESERSGRKVTKESGDMDYTSRHFS